MPSIKERVILAVGLDVVERPRQLQITADADEHSIVHTCYALKKQGLIEFRASRNIHAAGRNLTHIQLSNKGRQVYYRLLEEQR